MPLHGDLVPSVAIGKPRAASVPGHANVVLSLLDSHIQGTTRVVESAKKSSTLKRFIQTSSIAAIIDPFVHEKDPEHVFTEKDFNQTEDPSVTGDFYGYAKRVAEKIAVEAGADENTGFDAVVINPGVVIAQTHINHYYSFT